jgi:hypothetical protein
MFRKFGILFVVFALIAIAGATYAFAAAITGIPATSIAGEGKGVVNGLAATNIAYTIDDVASPAEVDAVSFTLTGSAGTETVKVQLDVSAADWYTCSYASTTWTCDTTATPLLLQDIDELRVIAYGTTFSVTPAP